jgi:hypothetical protein
MEPFHRMSLFFLRTGSISDLEELVQIRGFYAWLLFQLVFSSVALLTVLLHPGSSCNSILIFDILHILDYLSQEENTCGLSGSIFCMAGLVVLFQFLCACGGSQEELTFLFLLSVVCTFGCRFDRLSMAFHSPQSHIFDRSGNNGHIYHH